MDDVFFAEEKQRDPSNSRKKLLVNLLFIIHGNRYPTLVYLSQCKFDTFILKVNRPDCIPKKNTQKVKYSQVSGVPKAPCFIGGIYKETLGFFREPH